MPAVQGQTELEQVPVVREWASREQEPAEPGQVPAVWGQTEPGQEPVPRKRASREQEPVELGQVPALDFQEPSVPGKVSGAVAG